MPTHPQLGLTVMFLMVLGFLLPGAQAQTTVADTRIRGLAKHLHAGQIASIQFFGLLHGMMMPTMPSANVPLYPGFAPTVTDRRLIARFIRALRHADDFTGPKLKLATPSLEITFKQIGKSRRDPLPIDINFDYLGPRFQSVLNEVPGYLTAQLHRKIATLDGQVREVDFATLKVTDPHKIAQITQALKQVKPIALGVYGSPFDTFGLRLVLRQGGSEEVVFVLEHSNVSRLGSAVLPEPLWSYYKAVQPPQKRRLGRVAP